MHHSSLIEYSRLSLQSLWSASRLVCRYGRNEVTPRPQPRVKPEADDNARLDRGFRMATLMHSYQLPTSARYPPRIKREAAESAELGRGLRMMRLLHEVDCLPCSPRPVPRAVGLSAQTNLWRGVTGTVGKCLQHIGRKTYIFVPGEQKRPYSTVRTV